MIIEVIEATLALWLAFIVTVEIADGARSRDDLNWFQTIAVYVFVIFDVAYNYTYGAILFGELAHKDRKTLTARLKYILHSGHYSESGWRFRLALFMCKYMISPWHFNHCGLGLGKK